MWYPLLLVSLVSLVSLWVPLGAGRLADLQGACVPVLHAAGFWRGGLVFLLATSRIIGTHPHPTPGSHAAATLAAAAVEVGAPHALLPTLFNQPSAYAQVLSMPLPPAVLPPRFWCSGAVAIGSESHGPWDTWLRAGADGDPRARRLARRRVRGQHHRDRGWQGRVQ